MPHYLPHPTPLTTPQGRIRPSVLRPVALHAVRAYLPVTENWIYEQIRHANGFYPVVVCDERQDPRQFPIADLIANSDLRFSRAHEWINRLHRHLAYANWPGTYAGVMARFKPQLLHAHFGDRGVLMLATARRAKIPLITTFYGYDVSTLPLEPKWVPRLQWLFAHGSLFLAEGPHLRQRLLDLGCPPEKTRVHHLGVDLRHIPFQTRHAPAGPVRILMAASFREKKGMAYGLEAFARVVAQRRGQVQLTIIGDGPLKAELRALAQRLGVTPFIRWLGYQPHEVLLRECLAAHLFLAPSVVAADGDSEGGAPVVLLDAQATGLPVVATTHADIPEITRPGESALLVPERDVEALAACLAALIDAPERWAAMGAAGRAHVQGEYNAVEQGRRLEALYHEAIARHLESLRQPRRLFGGQRAIAPSP